MNNFQKMRNIPKKQKKINTQTIHLIKTQVNQ